MDSKVFERAKVGIICEMIVSNLILTVLLLIFAWFK
jgi:hypothetical protein